MKKEFGMNMENADLTKKARTALDDMWGEAILAALLVQGVSFGFGCVQTALGSGGDDVSISALVIACLVGLFGFFVQAPLDFGFARFCLSLSRGKPLSCGQVFYGFSRWGTVLAATILIGVFCALWSVLLIVPGILAALSYSMTFYIMMDEESISPMDAIRKSKKMMYGHRWRFVCFCFRYAGWLLLALLPYIAVYMVWGDSRPILSSAIMYAGLIPLSVYFGVGVAAFYEDLKTSQAPEVPTP